MLNGEKVTAPVTPAPARVDVWNVHVTWNLDLERSRLQMKQKLVIILQHLTSRNSHCVTDNRAQASELAPRKTGKRVVMVTRLPCV